MLAVHDFSDLSFLRKCAKFGGTLNEVSWVLLRPMGLAAENSDGMQPEEGLHTLRGV